MPYTALNSSTGTTSAILLSISCCIAGSALAGTVSSVMAVMVAFANGGSTTVCGKVSAEPSTASTQELAPVEAKVYVANAGLATVKRPRESVVTERSSPAPVGL
jgi:hypothetical protein